MQLLSKVAIVTIIIIAIAMGATLLLKKASVPSTVTASDAENFVLSDLYQHSPNATFTVLNVTGSTSNPGSWTVLVSATYNATKPCPAYETESFDYPGTNLAPVPNNIYVSDCAVHQIPSGQGGKIGIPVIAIATATSLNNSIINNYISTYGYSNVSANATFYPAYNSTSGLIGTFDNVWVIRYTASNSNSSVTALLDQYGVEKTVFTS